MRRRWPVPKDAVVSRMRDREIGSDRARRLRGVISRSLELTANATGRFGLVPATHPGSARFRPVRRTLGRYGGAINRICLVSIW